jgi:hypothetical protein
VFDVSNSMNLSVSVSRMDRYSEMVCNLKGVTT